MTDSYFKKLGPIIYALLIVLATVSITRPEPVRAHAGYDRSDPTANAVIPEPPAEVHVWFTPLPVQRPVRGRWKIQFLYCHLAC